MLKHEQIDRHCQYTSQIGFADWLKCRVQGITTKFWGQWATRDIHAVEASWMARQDEEVILKDQPSLQTMHSLQLLFAWFTSCEYKHHYITILPKLIYDWISYQSLQVLTITNSMASKISKRILRSHYITLIAAEHYAEIVIKIKPLQVSIGVIHCYKGHS